ncbi:hypothetical protein RB195_022334 [Necator americanus]|uniref:Uncharacterized protein n=1 Tax=Necator americanus TaxID=51031 RepID=A0ABR1EF65_NECAM
MQALEMRPPSVSETTLSTAVMLMKGNLFRADGVPKEFVRSLDAMNQRTVAAVLTPDGCTTQFEVVTGVRQEAVEEPFLFNFAIDDIVRETVEQRPANVVLAPSGCPLSDLEYTYDVTFAQSSTKIQHVVNLVSKLDGRFANRSEEPAAYAGYEKDIHQPVMAIFTSNSLTKCLWSTPITNEVKLRVYLFAICFIMMYGSETWVACSTVMEKLCCTERMLIIQLLGYFWPRVCRSEDLYAEFDVVCRRMTRGRYQHLALPSKVAIENRLRFFGHILPVGCLVKRVLRSLSGSNWEKPFGRKRKFWTEVVKEDLRTLGVDRQFRRDVRFYAMWSSIDWIDSVQALAEDREGWGEL